MGSSGISPPREQGPEPGGGKKEMGEGRRRWLMGQRSVVVLCVCLRIFLTVT